ncbi:hypothetical protein [Demequina zhanjiangensis]|uniref:Protein kinase domain-containing protein n=1 Tax=Demequina zhanjiangensis TaxID=3051659 RepID=A0ABT8G0P4_9MICO|nr:hypothetical protein [Demequina sp. SYSU T00b26]MDN4472662.1 hypothetical protein [Demequina sp. SYSU T00b26]
MVAEGEIAQIRRVIGVGEAVYVAAGARAEVVRALGAEELRAPDRVIMQGDAVIALMPVSHGVTLAEVIRASGPLSAGECVWVGTRVARALARLHRAGMAHGVVDAESILIDSGSAVLLDTGAGVASATQPDDVAALGRLLRASARTSDADVMTAWTDPMSADDPSGRPTAAMVARALPGAAEERPVALPGPSVASRMRESLASSEPASEGARRGKGKPASTGPRRPPVGRQERPSDRWSALASRLSTTPRRLAMLSGGAAAALVALTVTAAFLASAEASAAPTGDAAALARGLAQSGAAIGPGDPAQAAARLTERRFDALDAGDATALLATTAEGTPARARAEQQSASVTAGALVYDGLEVSVDATQVQEEGGDSAVVAIEYTMSGYDVTVSGETTHAEPATESVVLELVLDHGRWRVSEVSAN